MLCADAEPYSRVLNLLLTGPPASGKSAAALERFQSTPGSILLTPTATMAEHLRHQMAREGVALRPSSVQTLAGFLDQWDPRLTALAALVQLAIQDALEVVQPVRFQAVAGFRGFRAALAQLFEEVPDQAEEVLGPEISDVFREARTRISPFVLRKERLRSAVEIVKSAANLPPQIVLDGFFSLSRAELALVEALASLTQVTVVLPDSPGAAPARESLIRAGFEEQRFRGEFRKPVQTSFQAATMEQEAEEIARRTVSLGESGCPFREIGIVLRSAQPYGPILETTLGRFGIPVRSYFAPPLDSHPVVSYLSGLVRALLTGWNHADLAALLRMPVSGIGATAAGDRFDFQLRKNMPGRGLPLHGVADAPEILVRLAELGAWISTRLEASEWAGRLKGLVKLIPDPSDPRPHGLGLSAGDVESMPSGPAPGRKAGGSGAFQQDSRRHANAWRSTARAYAHWADAMDLTAASRGAGRIALKEFWQRAETVLAETPLRIPDRRRDAVALLDVFEARQWQLRVVFVCGLAERLFPHYHREDPILGDRARTRLGLSVAKERQAEERFLFDLATSRATQETVLSYARYNEKGDEQLASFFLDHAPAPLSGARMRPAPSREVYSGSPAPIQEPEQLARLADRHKTISPTAIEDFLQCPFLFFGRKTLRLKERPPQPRDRLDNLAQGSILHHALALWAQAPIFGASLLDQAFDEEIAARRIPLGYRTEAVRLELLRHFEAFLRDDQVPVPRDVRVEQKVSFSLNPTIAITGRIDRVDVGPGKQALVIDYKYSAAERIKKNVAQSEEGDRVQAGLYLLAAQKALGLDPVGMLYCGLRKNVSWNGWHLDRADLRAVGEARTKEALQELIEGARQATLETHEAILTGRIAPRPKDRDLCKRCDFRDICRETTLGEAMEAGAE